MDATSRGRTCHPLAFRRGRRPSCSRTDAASTADADSLAAEAPTALPRARAPLPPAALSLASSSAASAAGNPSPGTPRVPIPPKKRAREESGAGEAIVLRSFPPLSLSFFFCSVRSLAIAPCSLSRAGWSEVRQSVPDIRISSREPAQGDTLAVLVQVPGSRGPLGAVARLLGDVLAQHGGRLGRDLTGLKVSFGPVPGTDAATLAGTRSYTAFPTSTVSDGKVWRVTIPTTPLDPPGEWIMRIETPLGMGSARSIRVRLRARDFPTQSIWLPEGKAHLQGSTAEWEAMARLNAVVSPKQLWVGPFRRPTEGPVTTVFGVQRYYNGHFAHNYYHRGVDYGAPEGTPVMAPNAGRVVLVGRERDGFEFHGNCVGVDHGQGVVSIFMHLHDIAVREGEEVRPGMYLGSVGETGIATGPHLHWGLSVHGLSVDPAPWMVAQRWLAHSPWPSDARPGLN